LLRSSRNYPIIYGNWRFLESSPSWSPPSSVILLFTQWSTKQSLPFTFSEYSVLYVPYPRAYAVWELGLKPLDCWGRGFEFLWGHGLRPLCSLCVVQLWKEPITRSLETYHVCVSNCVWSRHRNNEATWSELGCCATEIKCYMCHLLIQSSLIESFEKFKFYSLAAVIEYCCVMGSMQC
jgi:hypothetical protein